MGEIQNQLFQHSSNVSLKVDFQGSCVTSDGGLILVRELDERLGFRALIERQLVRSDDSCAAAHLRRSLPTAHRALRGAKRISSPRDVARTIRVRKGDTLWKIAATQLGSGLAWTCVVRANPDLADANFILPEQVLNLPLRCQEISKARE
jgi:nucleoid-associated protein YgaU